MLDLNNLYSVSLVSVDRVQPVFSNCPANINQGAPFGTSTVLVQWMAPTATDNSGVNPNVVTQAQNPGNYPVGTTTITYRATDGAGNVAICTFDIIVTQQGVWDIFFHEI